MPGTIAMLRRPILRVLFSSTFLLLASQVAGQAVNCGGPDEREYHCRVDTSRGVILLQEVGRTRCIRGYTWDYGDGEIWVDHGCAAQFALASRAPVAWQEETTPVGKALASCAADTVTPIYCVEIPDMRAELVRERSDVPCREGKNWGVDARGLWLSRGCAADFLVKQYHATGQDALTVKQLVECRSAEGQRNFCAADARGGAVLRAVVGHAPCKPGASWDWNEGGVWVDHGCSGLFEVAGARETPGAPAMFPRCYLSVGEALAEEWEAECYALHPGKFASCNARNSCAALTAATRRGCKGKGDAAPEYCEKYRADDE